MDHTKPGQHGCDGCAGRRRQQAGLDHVHEHARQQHRRDDLALLKGEGPGGPHIGLGQGRQHGWPKGVGGRATATGPQPRFQHQGAPAGQPGQQPQGHGRSMARRRGLEGLGSDHQADVKHDRHAGFNRHQLADHAKQAQQAGAAHHHPIEPGVADAGAHGLPARVADVDGGGKAGAQGGGGQGANAIDQHRAGHRIAIAGGFGALQVLQRADHIEKSHRHDYPQPGH